MIEDDDNSEQRFKDKYAARAKEQTLETLPAFINEMLAEEHDYGTICHCIAIAAAATAWAINASPQGGITGFQGGAINWEFIRNWDPSILGKFGARLLSYEDLLYPQMEYKFTSITPSVWQDVQHEAAKRLVEKQEFTHPDVYAQWQSIANGVVPFGLTVKES